ncbi:unnamed protein product, partial [Urochloa humidicola]
LSPPLSPPTPSLSVHLRRRTLRHPRCRHTHVVGDPRGGGRRGTSLREGEGGGGEIRLAAPARTLGLDPLRAAANFEAEEEEQVATAFGERERRQILRRRRPQQRLGRGAPASRDVLVSSVARRSSCSGVGAARRSSASSTEEEEWWPAEQQCLVHRGGGVAAATSSIGCCLLRHGRPRPGGDPGERGGPTAVSPTACRRRLRRYLSSLSSHSLFPPPE